MAVSPGKPWKKSSIPGVSIRQLVQEIPEGCSTPDFKQKPVALALQEGKNAIFRAVVCGEPTPEVYWHSTRGALNNGSKYQITAAPGSREHVLQINKLTGEDSDLYRCTAVNAYGEATCSVRLTVIEVGFRKNQKRQKEPQEDLRKELMDFRKMLKKRAPPPAPEKKMESEQVWKLLMAADRKDYEKICMKYGIVDFRGMLHKLQEMKKEREDKMAQYVNTVSNLRHIKVTKDGVATFDLELDLKDLESKIYLYKDGEMTLYGFDNQTKHCLRRLGKRYHFRVQDLRPEDAGLYQVMVEDAVVFSTELESSAIPPRVVVPLAEAHCEEQEDAVFECTLSNPCPDATWHFQHRPLKLRDKYEVSVSPDGLTHRLVVRGAGCSDMGLYSLNTGLHASSAWLVVEGGKDKGPQSTDVDHQLQTPAALSSDAEDSRGISGKEGQPGEQSSSEGTQLIVGPDRSGFGRHGYSLMGDGGEGNSAWGSGQDKKGFLEADQGGVILPRDGDWDGSLAGRSPLQGEGPGSQVGFMERRQQGHGRDGDGDKNWGAAGVWGAGRPGSSREGREPGEDNDSELDGHGQGQLWAPQLGAGTEQRALWGSQSDAERAQLKGERIESLQGNHADEMEGRDGLGGEAGTGTAKAVGVGGTCLGGAGGSCGAGSLGVPAFPRGRSSSSKAGMGSESWGWEGGRDADHGEAGGCWESGDPPGLTSAGNGTQKPSLSGSRKLFLGYKSPETQTGGSWQGGQGVGGRGHETVPKSPGAMKNWEGGLRELQGGGGRGTAGALGGPQEGFRGPQSPQRWRVGQNGAGRSGRTESENTGPQGDPWSSLGKTETHFGSGVLESGGEEGSVDGSRATGQRADDRNLRLIMSAGLGVQGPGGTLGEMDRFRHSGAVGSEPDVWNRSGSSRERGSRGEMGYRESLGGLGWVESECGEGLGHSEGRGSRNGAACHEGSGRPGGAGCGRRTGGRATPGAPVETESEEGGTYRRGSGAPRGMLSGSRGHYAPAGRGSGRVPSLGSVSGGPHGTPMDEAQFGDVHGSHGPPGPGGEYCSDGGLGSPGIVGSVGRGGLKTPGAVETTGEGLLEAEPGGSGRMKSWDQTWGYGGFGAAGTLGGFGERGLEDGTGVPGSMEPGSQGPGSRVGDGDGIRLLGARASQAETRTWDNAGHPKALGPHTDAVSESHGDYGSGNAVGYGDESEIPEAWGSEDRKAYGEGSKGHGPGRAGPGSEAGSRHSSGEPRGEGAAGEAHYYKNGVGGSGVMGSTCDMDYGNIGGSGTMASRGYKKNIEGSGIRESGGYRNGSGDSGTIPSGNEKGGSGGLEHSGSILSRHEAGFIDSFGGARGTRSTSEVSYNGGSGGSGEMGSEGKMCCTHGSGRLGGPGSVAGPKAHRTMGPRSGYQTAGEQGTSSKDGTGKAGGKGLANGAETGVDSGMAGMLVTTGGIAHRDRNSATGPAKLGTQGVTHIFPGGQSTGGCGLSGISEALGTVGSMGKPDVREYQDGSGIPGSPGDRGIHKREGKSADRAEALGTSRLLDGRGTMEGENQARMAALESGHDWDFNKTGSEIADSRAVGQWGVTLQGGRDSLPEGRRKGTGSGNLSGMDQMVDSSSIPGRHAKSRSGSDSGQEVNHAWTSGWEDQAQGGSRVSSSLQEKDATFMQTHEGKWGSRLRGAATGQEAAGECQGTRSLERRGSGLRRDGGDHTEDSSVLGKGKPTVLGDGVILKPGQPQPWGAQNGLDSILGRNGCRGGSGGIEDSGSHLGTGQGGERGSLQEWGSLEAKIDKAQGSSASKKYERQGGEDPGWPDRKPGPCGRQSGTEVGSAKRGATGKFRSLERWTGSEDRVSLGENWREDGSQSPRGHLSSRRSTREVSVDIRGQGQDATQSPRFRSKLGAGSLSTEDRGTLDYFSQGLADTEVHLGETAVLCCTLTSDLGPGTWFKDGVKLTAQDGVIFEQDGLMHRLTLTNVDGTQAGRYTFVAGRQHSEASLTVQDPPTIAPDVTEKLGEPVVVKAGKPVTVKIPFQSRLPVQAAWRKDGDEVIDSSHKSAQVSLSDGCLRLCLPSVGRKDSGQYSVTLRSEGGCAQAEFTLQVIDKPQPPRGPLEVQDCHRAGVCLRWRPPRDDGGQVVEHYVVERRQANRSTWLKVGEAPPDSTSFTDASVEQGRKYTFRVRAVTSEGAGDTLESEEVLVAPEALPGPPSAPAILSSSSKSITLTWVAPQGPGNAHILGYLVEKHKKGSHTWMAVSEQPVPVRPKFLVDSRTKDTLTVRVGNSIRVPVSFEAVPMPEVTWLKDGLPLPKRSVTTTKDSLTQLLVPAASLSDRGRYTVVLTSLQGEEAVYSFLLRVAACPQAPGSIFLRENVPGTVTVQWEPSPDEAQGAPLHYTVLMRSSSHGSWREVADRIHTNCFTLLGILPGHEYHFRVVAKNELGASKPSDTSQPWYIPRQRGRLMVKAPTYQEPNLSQKPRFLVGLRSHLLPQGCECRMTCAVQGSPPPRVTWFKNDQSLDGNPALYSTDMLGVCSLIILSVSPEDSGEYKAVAENSLGQAVSTATLIVTESSF